MGKKSKPMKVGWQIALGVAFIIWGGGSLIYQMQPGVIGIKSIPIFILIAGIVNLYIGIKRSNSPEKAAGATTQEEVNEAMLAGKKTPVEPPSPELQASAVYQFLFGSYEIWKEGVFDDYSDYYSKTTTKNSPTELTASMMKEKSYTQFLEQCFKHKQPDNGEVMFALSPDSFMMTNTHLYLNTHFKKGEMRVISLCDITEYTNKGVWTKSGTIKKKSGGELEFKIDAVPDENAMAYLQKLQNCDTVISV
jgi:hypothetical protein